MAAQMPSMPQKIGKISTAATWNTTVLRKEIVADTIPLLRAVKNEEPKILNPQSKKEIA